MSAASGDKQEPCPRPDCRHTRFLLAESAPLFEWEAWRDVAIALVAEIADELLDPNSIAMQAYHAARNKRYHDASLLARDAIIVAGVA